MGSIEKYELEIVEKKIIKNEKEIEEFKQDIARVKNSYSKHLLKDHLEFLERKKVRLEFDAYKLGKR